MVSRSVSAALVPKLSGQVVYDVIEFVLSVTDPDGDEIVSLYAEGLPVGAFFDETTGAFSWRPDGNQAGVYIVSFFAVDNGVPTKTGRLDVIITVGEVESPTDLTETIIEDILADDLPVEVENAYLANLKKVVEMFEEGRVTPALNQLEAFIHKVEVDVDHGSITPAQGDLYIMMAQDVIDLLTGN